MTQEISLLTKNKRTLQQNAALHLYCKQVADTLNDAGLEISVMLPNVDIPWRKESVKELLWRTIQKATLDKQSTADLSKEEVSKVYEVMNRYLAQHKIPYIPFPSYEEF